MVIAKQKSIIGYSDEEDSHNYLEDESEVLTADEEVEIYEYSYREKFVDFLCSKYVVLFVVAAILYVVSFIFWKSKFEIVVVGSNGEGVVEERSVGIGVFLISTLLVSIAVIEWVLRHLSLHELKRARGEGNFWYNLNELSGHVAVLIGLVFLLCFLVFTVGNFYINRTRNARLYSYDFLRISIITTVLFGIQKIIVKNISMSFNYNIYINRIKKCLLFDFFINLISGLSEDNDNNEINVNNENEDIDLRDVYNDNNEGGRGYSNEGDESSNNINKEKNKNDFNSEKNKNKTNEFKSNVKNDHDIVYHYNTNDFINGESCTVDDVLINGTKRDFSTVVFQKRFLAKDLSNISQGAKRLLLKEFQEVAKGSVRYSGSLPTILGKIRSVAIQRAEKLVRKIKRNGRYGKSGSFEKIGDLRRLFRDACLFEYLIDGLEINKEEAITSPNIVRIIERAYRERYVVYKSIEQVNAAIDKLAVCAKILIGIFAIFVCYISTETASDSIFIGAFSTLIGGHIFNRIISDHVINSAIFLFIIRPFDIGDRIRLVLNGIEENLIVSELNVFSTQFYRWDGTVVFIPNHILHNSPITNIRRSGSTMENHSIQISSDTHPEKLYTLKQMLIEFVKENSHVYTDYILVNYEKIEDSNKLFIKVLVQYKTNCQNYESYLKKRSYFIIELNRCLQALGITYKLPIRNINIQPISNKKDTEQDKDKLSFKKKYHK